MCPVSGPQETLSSRPGHCEHGEADGVFVPGELEVCRLLVIGLDLNLREGSGSDAVTVKLLDISDGSPDWVPKADVWKMSACLIKGPAIGGYVRARSIEPDQELNVDVAGLAGRQVLLKFLER
jgi:hypothetical protein